jgi:hypothetical protein
MVTVILIMVTVILIMVTVILIMVTIILIVVTIIRIMVHFHYFQGKFKNLKNEKTISLIKTIEGILEKQEK